MPGGKVLKADTAVEELNCRLFTVQLPAFKDCNCTSVNEGNADKRLKHNDIKHDRQDKRTMDTESDEERREIKSDRIRDRLLNQRLRERRWDGRKSQRDKWSGSDGQKPRDEDGSE